MSLAMGKLTTSYVDNWCQGKPLPIATFAQSFALGVDRLHALLSSLKSGELHGKPSDTSLKEWLAFYFAKRKLLGVILDESERLMPEGSPASIYQNTVLRIFEAHKLLTIEQSRIANGQRPNKEKLAYLKKEIQAFRGESLDIIHLPIQGAVEKDRAAGIENSSKSSLSKSGSCILFIRNVWIPSTMLYGAFPPLLFRKARLGDLESLENLVRLDKSVIFDRVISEKFHKLRLSEPEKAQYFFGLINKAPKIAATRKKAKYLAGGLLQYLSMSMSLLIRTPQLSAPEIQDLFDACAKDAGLGDQDPDFINIQPDGFYRGIKEACEHWTVTFSPGIK